MNASRSARACMVLAVVLSCAPPLHAQDFWSQRIISDMVIDTVMGNFCADAARRHERLPAACAGSVAGTAKLIALVPSPTAMRFAPVAGDDSVKKLADSLGSTPEERQQILQLANAGAQMYALKYAGNGWSNNITGAMTFFIVSTVTVQAGHEPDAASQQRLFDALNATLAQSDIARASNRDKTALYNALLACAGLPLVFYVDGSRNGNAAEVGKAKEMATGFSRKLLGVEPQALAAMLQAANGGNAGAPAAATPAARPVASAGTHALDGRYDCQMLSVRAGASFSVEYRPIGLWFVIDGNGYTAAGGGGRVDGGADVVGFRGGAYDGWRGARVNDAIVFRKEDHSQPLPGETVRNGDIRCGRRG